MELHSINAELRAAGSKGDARKVRGSGRTPGVVYRAGEPASAVAFDGPALAAIFRKTGDANTIVTVNLDGTARTCILREVQRHPVNRRVEHVDFQEVAAGERVAVRVPVATTGRAAGVRAGGQLRVLARSVNLDCDAYAIPRVIEVDVTLLEIGRFIRASELRMPANTKIVYKQDFNIVTVEGKIKDVAAAAPADAKAAPAAKGAPAAKAAAKAAPAKK